MRGRTSQRMRVANDATPSRQRCRPGRHGSASKPKRSTSDRCGESGQAARRQGGSVSMTNCSQSPPVFEKKSLCTNCCAAHDLPLRLRHGGNQRPIRRTGPKRRTAHQNPKAITNNCPAFQHEIELAELESNDISKCRQYVGYQT